MPKKDLKETYARVALDESQFTCSYKGCNNTVRGGSIGTNFIMHGTCFYILCDACLEEFKQFVASNMDFATILRVRATFSDDTTKVLLEKNKISVDAADVMVDLCLTSQESVKKALEDMKKKK